MRLPNVHIIGTQKAATTSLFNWLGQHPDIYAPLAAKDYPIFADTQTWAKGLSSYAELFKNHTNQKIVLAGSVHTLMSQKALKKLHQSFPDARLIVILRDPVERLLSAFNYRKKSMAEPLNFIQALNNEEDRRKSGVFEDVAGGAYVRQGLYFEHLHNLFELFPQKQVKIIWFEDIREQPSLVVKDIFQFFDVPPSATITYTKKNVSGKVRSRRLMELSFGQNRFRKLFVDKILSKIMPLEQRTQLRHWIKEINTIHSPPVTPDGFDRKMLIKLFLQDIENLERLTERDLTKWKS